MSAREAATAALLTKVLADRIDAATKAAKTAAVSELEVGDRITAKVGDDPIGTVSLENGGTYATVTNEAALLAFAERYEPDAIETVRRIRSDVLERWMRDVKANGAVLIEATGELVEPAGIAVRQGAPRAVIRARSDAGRVVEDAVRSGQLDLRSVLAIEGGDPR